MTIDLSVLSDAPIQWSQDLLRFDRYVGALTEVIMSEQTETPFTIGVFGAWGSGKSSLLGMIDQKLAKSYHDEVVRVHFNPWVYRRESSMLVPLLHTLQDTLAEDPKARFIESARRLGVVLAKLSMGVLLGKLSGGVVSLEKLEDLAKSYAEQRGQVESEVRNLRITLQEQADIIQRKGARLVFFIDDLDRCEPTEIIDLLESIKLFLDLQNVFIIIAIAKDVVDRGVAVKYRDFGFAAEKVVAVGDEYLDKMIQLPLYVLPIDAGGVGKFMRGLDLPNSVAEQVNLLQEIVSPNPRRIKRVLNMCALTYAILQKSPGLGDLRKDLIARLVVLRIQSPELYALIASRPNLLVALELVYKGDLNADRTEGFVTRYGTAEGGSMQEAVKRFHDSQEYLRRLFIDSRFAEVVDDLQSYLTMLGG